MANHIRATIEIGPKCKKVVGVALDWQDLESGAKTADEAIELLFSCVPRNATVTKLAGMKVNAGAVGRIIQLTQEGYVQIQPETWRM